MIPPFLCGHYCTKNSCQESKKRLIKLITLFQIAYSVKIWGINVNLNLSPSSMQNSKNSLSRTKMALWLKHGILMKNKKTYFLIYFKIT